MIYYGHAKVAQLVEHSTENAGVVSSILSLGTSHVQTRHTAVTLAILVRTTSVFTYLFLKVYLISSQYNLLTLIMLLY